MLAAPRRALMALVLVVLALVSGAWSWDSRPNAAAKTSISSQAVGALQEVAPPGAVQQLSERLNTWAPQLRVISPADNTVLPAGSWTLKLQVSDWPLADANDLGLGPHLVVQVDQDPPLRIASQEEAQAITMPELRPGSHRLTVYAARPWGEAVKSPGASRQLRLHRVTVNAAELPAPGTAQLIVTSPDALQQGEPVLIDWLLLDAPLQHLRGDDSRWRLRVSVNGDSFLVDRQTPLWLKGWRRGSNALQLELLDERGEALNPPFNSVVKEVLIDGSNRPAWQRPSLSAAELARLSGDEPSALAAAEPSPPADASQPATDGERGETDTAAAAAPRLASPATEPAIEPATELAGANASAATPEPAPLDEPTANAGAVDASANGTTDATGVVATTVAAPNMEATALDGASDPAAAEPPALPAAAKANNPETPKPDAVIQGPAEISAPPSSGGQASTQRISPSSSLSGSARSQVNADGSLQRTRRPGPLAGLREKLAG